MANHHQQQQQLPDDFRCPISLEIMRDPVILTTGHTFDRCSIQRWIDSGHRTCPISNLPLPDNPLLIPNHALRSLISNFTLLSSPKLPEPKNLISSLNAKSSSVDVKIESLSHLNKMVKKDSVFRRKLSELGVVSVVLKCFDDYDCGDGVVKEKALLLLLSLSLDDDNKVGLVAEGVLGRVVGVLTSGFESCRAVAATLLTSLAVVEVNKATIGGYPGAVDGLVWLLGEGDGREQKEAATALFAVCSFPGNRRRVVESGAVPVLVRVVESGVERGVEVLGLLAKCREGRESIGRVGGVVRVLCRVLECGSSRGVQFGLLTLGLVCGGCEMMCAEARSEGVVEVCLRLAEDDNEKIRRNAVSLARVLQGGSSVGR